MLLQINILDLDIMSKKEDLISMLHRQKEELILFSQRAVETFWAVLQDGRIQKPQRVECIVQFRDLVHMEKHQVKKVVSTHGLKEVTIGYMPNNENLEINLFKIIRFSRFNFIFFQKDWICL